MNRSVTSIREVSSPPTVQPAGTPTAMAGGAVQRRRRRRRGRCERTEHRPGLSFGLKPADTCRRPQPAFQPASCSGSLVTMSAQHRHPAERCTVWFRATARPGSRAEHARLLVLTLQATALPAAVVSCRCPECRCRFCVCLCYGSSVNSPLTFRLTARVVHGACAGEPESFPSLSCR